MGLLVILVSFLQLCFSLIKVFRSLKQGVRQIDYIQRYTNTFPDPFREKPLIISYRKVMAIGGRSQERGGQCKGYYCSPFRKPLGQPLGSLQMVVSHVLEARAHSIQFSSILEALPPQGFVSYQSILFYNRAFIAPCLQSPLTLRKSY